MCESIFETQTRTQSLVYFWHETAAQAGIFNSFFRPVFQGPQYIKFLKDIEPSSMLTEFVLDIRHVASFRNKSALKAKFGPNFAIFAPSLRPCKN